MPCSCGNTTCPCGIPCCCLEESCKCHACAIALHNFCKICSKPLITDVQTSKDTCSCFVGESTASRLENRDNQPCRNGNMPMPVGFFVPIIPVPVMRFPQFLLQKPISLMFPPPLIHTDSRSILPSFTSNMDVVTPLPARKNFGIPSTSQSRGQSSSCASSGISSTGTQDTEMSSEETCPSIDLQSTEERKTTSIMQNTKSAAEDHGIEQEPPSIRFGNISYPIVLADPVWRFPNPAFCIAGSPDSSPKLWNPFYVAGPFHTTQTMTNFEKECQQTDSGLNSDSDDPSQAECVKTLQMNEKSIDPTKITRQSDLKIHDEHVRIDASLPNATGNEFTVFPSWGNSNDSNLTEQCKQPAFYSLRSNEMSDNHLMNDETLASVSTDISSSGRQELSAPACAVSTSAAGKNDCPQVCSVDCSVTKSISTDEMWQNPDFPKPHQIPSTTQNIPEHFGVSNIGSNLPALFNNRSAQSSEQNEYRHFSNSSSTFINDRKNEEIHSIPLYIDNYTTWKMETLLKPKKYSSNSLVH